MLASDIILRTVSCGMVIHFGVVAIIMQDDNVILDYFTFYLYHINLGIEIISHPPRFLKTGISAILMGV